MSLFTETTEIVGIVNRMLDNMLLMVSSQTVSGGAALRRQIGVVRAKCIGLLRSGEFSAELLSCFTLAREIGVKLSGFVVVRKGLIAEVPVGEISTIIVRSSIMFCLATESRMITAIEFVSRDDVDAMMQTMKIAFDEAIELAADTDTASYKELLFLAGALTSFLSLTSRPLPRMITFKLPISLPLLVLSNRVYYTADRWEELLEENHIVHPLFPPREVKGLSS